VIHRAVVNLEKDSQSSEDCLKRDSHALILTVGLKDDPTQDNGYSAKGARSEVIKLPQVKKSLISEEGIKLNTEQVSLSAMLNKEHENERHQILNTMQHKHSYEIIKLHRNRNKGRQVNYQQSKSTYTRKNEKINIWKKENSQYYSSLRPKQVTNRATSRIPAMTIISASNQGKSSLQMNNSIQTGRTDNWSSSLKKQITQKNEGKWPLYGSRLNYNELSRYNRSDGIWNHYNHRSLYSIEESTKPFIWNFKTRSNLMQSAPSTTQLFKIEPD
jgi:hypothetical protein